MKKLIRFSFVNLETKREKTVYTRTSYTHTIQERFFIRVHNSANVLGMLILQYSGVNDVDVKLRLSWEDQGVGLSHTYSWLRLPLISISSHSGSRHSAATVITVVATNVLLSC